MCNLLSCKVLYASFTYSINKMKRIALLTNYIWQKKNSHY